MRYGFCMSFRMEGNLFFYHHHFFPVKKTVFFFTCWQLNKDFREFENIVFPLLLRGEMWSVCVKFVLSKFQCHD